MCCDLYVYLYVQVYEMVVWLLKSLSRTEHCVIETGGVCALKLAPRYTEIFNAASKLI
jgi:hypothetical protein